MQKRQSFGFTLVEIMIVVVIIGMLAAIAVASFMKVRDIAQDKAVLNNLRQIAGAAQMYMLEKGANSVSPAGDLYGIYLQEPENVAGETYPATIGLNDSSIQATGLAGGRTVTYVF